MLSKQEIMRQALEKYRAYLVTKIAMAENQAKRNSISKAFEQNQTNIVTTRKSEFIAPNPYNAYDKGKIERLQTDLATTNTLLKELKQKS